MAYVVPTTFTAGSVLPAAQMNVLGSDIVDHEARLLKMGLVFVSSTSFSAQTTVNVDSVFSSTYANYKIVFNAYQTGAAGTNNVNVQMRAGASTYSGATYDYAGWSVFGDGSTSTLANNLQTNWTGVFQANGTNAGTNHGYASIEMFAPNLTTWTSFSGLRSQFNASPNQFYSGFIGGQVKQTTQYDGIAFSCANAITGVVRIYGLLNS